MPTGRAKLSRWTMVAAWSGRALNTVWIDYSQVNDLYDLVGIADPKELLEATDLLVSNFKRARVLHANLLATWKRSTIPSP
jgi:hypothetical protein